MTNPTETTICVKDLAECPIIDIFVVNEAEIEGWKSKGFEVTRKGFLDTTEEGSSNHIAFSKNQTRNGTDVKDPIISTVMNTREPCFGPEKDGLILTKE